MAKNSFVAEVTFNHPMIYRICYTMMKISTKCPNPRRRETLLCGTLKGLMEALINPFEASKRSVKTKF